MKFLLGLIICQSVLAQELFINVTVEDRLIEPTSPTLGYELSQKIRISKNHPSEIFKKIKQDNNHLERDLLHSSKTYIDTLFNPLNDYCKNSDHRTPNRSQYTEVEHAAIPLEVLIPLHEDYLENLTLNESLPYTELKEQSARTAKAFQYKRSNCGTALAFQALEEKFEKLCFGLKFCLKAKNLNSKLSSAEAGFPRVQYSLNGYTRYVYKELLNSPRLEQELSQIYNLELHWFLSSHKKDTFFEYVAREAIKQRISPKSVFLYLAYSMRNMPSLDIEYSLSPIKSLLLEVYFWKFREIKKRFASSPYLIFPGHDKNDLSPYHFFTAGLLSCEARLAGLNSSTAILLGVLSKLGYKANKLIKAIDKEKLKRRGIKYILELAKKQGFKDGYLAGKYGSLFGNKICGSSLKSNIPK